jgi:hypothetical protein
MEPPNVRPAEVTDVKLYRVFAAARSGKTVVEIRR